MNPDHFTQQRIDWLEQGNAVLANATTDGALIALATQTGRFRWIDRKTAWGNPWKVRAKTVEAYQLVVDQYRQSFASKRDLHARLPELAGMVLVCHCTPVFPCHGEVILDWLDPVHGARYREACAAQR